MNKVTIEYEFEDCKHCPFIRYGRGYSNGLQDPKVPYCIKGHFGYQIDSHQGHGVVWQNEYHNKMPRYIPPRCEYYTKDVIEESGTNLLEEINNLKEEVNNKLQEENNLLNTHLEEYNLFKKDVDTKFEESSSSISEHLDEFKSFKTNINEEINENDNELNNHLNDFNNFKTNINDKFNESSSSFSEHLEEFNKNIITQEELDDILND